jgi:hypothetical protein
MSRWGSQSWESDAASDWFRFILLEQIDDIDLEISTPLKYPYGRNDDEARAVAYFLQVLGISAIWPGDLEKLKSNIQRAIEVLTAMINQKSDSGDTNFCVGNDSQTVESVKEQVRQLESRLLNLINDPSVST